MPKVPEFDITQDLGVGDPPPERVACTLPEIEALIISGQMYLTSDNQDVRNAGQAIIRLGHEAEHLYQLIGVYDRSISFYQGLCEGYRERLATAAEELAKFRNEQTGDQPPVRDAS